MNKKRSKMFDTGNNDGADGFTYKLDIGLNSIYVKTAWSNGTLVYIDITVSLGSKCDGIPKTIEELDLEHQRCSESRSWIEVSCKSATLLLESGASIDEIIGQWMGVRGFPNGYCPQLESLVPGPLHAAALLLQKRKDEWSQSNLPRGKSP